MRTIIAGSRDCTEMRHLGFIMRRIDWTPTVILSGHARGADMLGELWSREHNISLEVYPADWEVLGKTAGMVRNIRMAQKADALVALWDGKSKGTKHMIDTAKGYGLRVCIYRYDLGHYEGHIQI